MEPRPLTQRYRLFGIVTLLLTMGMGCAGAEVLNPNPSVRFTRPAGTVMFVKSGGGVTRALFDGNIRTAPTLCDETNALIDVRVKGPSRLHTLQAFASRPGFARVQLHDAKGKLLARGRLCIFPTLKAADPAMMKGYLIEIPPKVMRRLAKGKRVAFYQSYRPLEPKDRHWQYVAWVIYLDPR